jgi:pimeloyl-ACP methyl ester carboxylesterase
MVAHELRSVALNVESVVIPDCGHYPAEEQPAALLDALQRFLRLS